MFRRFGSFAVAILAFADVPAVADEEAPQGSYTKPTPDGLHLFVMIAPSSKALEIRKSRITYTQSGLYRNDGSSTPIWTVNWYAHNIDPLSDGVHLVRRGPWADSWNSEAVAFFAKGKLIRSYTVRELVADPSLMPHSISHFTWRSYEHLNDQDKIYTIETKHGERYSFDVTTGVITSSFSPSLLFSSIRWLLAVALILVVGTLGYWWWRRKQHAKEVRGIRFTLRGFCGSIVAISVLLTLLRLGTEGLFLLPVQTAILLAIFGRLKTAGGILLVLFTISIGPIMTVAP